VITARKHNSVWRLAPYWEGAVVTVESQEITPWRVVDEDVVDTVIEEEFDDQIRLAL
jgi:hypothetical protein